MKKAKIKNKQSNYKITKSDGTKLSLKKISFSEGDTLPLKDATSKENRRNLSEGPSSRSETNKDATSKENRGNLGEDPSSCPETNKISKKKKRRKKKTITYDKENEETKENFCEATCSNETNKINISSKEMRRNEETNCDEVSEKKTINPKISFHKICHSEGKEFTKEVSDLEISKYRQNITKLPSLKMPAFEIVPYDENLISGPVTVYEVALNNDNTDRKVYVETTTYNKANKSENPVKEKSSHETLTCDEANKSQNPIKKESSHETSTCDKANKSENPDKGEFSHETTTCDERNKSEIPAREEPPQKITSDEKNDKQEIQNNSSIMKIEDTKNILRGEKVPYDTTSPIAFQILRALKENPEFIGQVDATTGEQITFQQMRENSIKCALMLKTLFIRNCVSIVTICTRNPMLEYIPYLAALYLGATVNPWEEEYFSVGVRVYYFLVRHRPGVIFVDDHNALQLRETIDTLKETQGLQYEPIIIVFNKKEGFLSLQEILAHEVDKEAIETFSILKPDIKDGGILMFSSNATHYPGDVIIPYLAFMCPSMQVLKMNYGEIGLWYGSLCWTHSLFLTISAIISCTTALKCPKRLFTEEHLYQTIEKNKVTWIFLESSMCHKMCLTNFMVDIYDISSLKTFLFGDTPIEEGIHEDFVMYMSDVSVMQVYCDAQAGVIAYQRKSGNLQSSGHLSSNLSVKIIDINTGNIMGPNKRGEILCQTLYTPYSGKVYISKDIICSMNNRYEEWHCTGDYGYFDEDGEIYIIDKVRHLIRYKDTIISAAEIEDVLLRHVTVAEVAVVPTQNANDGQHPMAFVRSVFGLQATETELVNHVAQHMDDNCKLRGGVYFVKKFKYLPNGKIDRQRLTYDVKYRKNERKYARIGNSVVEL